MSIIPETYPVPPNAPGKPNIPAPIIVLVRFITELVIVAPLEVVDAVVDGMLVVSTSLRRDMLPYLAEADDDDDDKDDVCLPENLFISN